MTTLRKLPMKAPITKPITQVSSGNIPYKAERLPGPRGRYPENRPGRPRIIFAGGPESKSGQTYSSPPPAERLSMTLTSGRNIAMTMKPTTKPRKTMRIGSKAAVSEARVASTSDS